MDNVLFKTYKIDDRSQVAYIKRELHGLLRPVFGINRTGEIDIVISELCSNIIKYAGKGELLYRLKGEEGAEEFELLCIDNGPGMKDVAHSTKDGVSTTNTLGHGLGTIYRLSSLAQIYSMPGWGTIVYVKICHDDAPVKNRPAVFHYCCLNVAYPGEEVSGDGMAVNFFEDKRMTLMTGDGLGHGIHAADAANAAINSFKKNKSLEPAEILKEIHLAVKKTRGLVASVVAVNMEKNEMHIAGIGNIQVRIQSGIEYRNYMSHNGIVGLNIPNRIQSADYTAEKKQLVFLCSDGIKTSWDLIRYPGILKYDLLVIAAVLYKDHGRQTDDMTVTILKIV